MTEWTWGYLIWGLRWLLIGFLGFELAAKDVFGLAPWPSLSATWEHSIRTYPILGPLTFGCFIFLGVHWIYGRKWWQSVLYGLVVAGVAHWLDHRL
jgi:hypothetical protein